ncbi:hypothetical protein [Flammeovirga sp. SJP92]|uniref:hypothetical protein n=1 Tax=Flammeovirga sp. SJP92 TaxID=1775430 RepID=UPI000788C743|nr:hypothetical protein [Flammeovirga sp. SJP92]KXX67838.1 hypothetical protein AVL50_25595 [Flammeovirga sp. SJP92]
MKTLLLSIILTSFANLSTHAQNHLAQEAFDAYWNSLSEDNNTYSQQKIEQEKREIQKVRKLIHESIRQELAEVKELSGDLLTNFAVIEDHFHQEFEKLGLSYTHYANSDRKSDIALESWVDNHTNMILKHKLSHAEEEINNFYDRNH